MALYFRGGNWDDSLADSLKLQGANVTVANVPWTVSWWAFLEQSPVYYDKLFGYGMLGNTNEDNSGSYGTAGGFRFGIANNYGYQLSLTPAGGYGSYVWYNRRPIGCLGENRLGLWRWHHFVAVGTNSGGESRGLLYIDGEYLPDQTYYGGYSFKYTLTDVPDFYIGKPGIRANNSATRPFTGGIAEVAYWNENLGEARCRALFSASDVRQVGSSALQFYLPLHDSNPFRVYGAQSGSITVTKTGNPTSLPHPQIAAQNNRAKSFFNGINSIPGGTKMPRAFASQGAKLGQRQPFYMGTA